MTIHDSSRGAREFSVDHSCPLPHRQGNHRGLPLQIRFIFACFAVNPPNPIRPYDVAYVPFVVKFLLRSACGFAALALCRQRIDPLAQRAAADFSDHTFQLAAIHPDAAALIAAVQSETVESVAF
jgi:hypothetical protein